MKKMKQRLRKKNKLSKLPSIMALLLIMLGLSGYLWYKNNVVTPSINLADGLDAEEAAFLQKSISKDKKFTSSGVASAPVVKVTVNKDNGEEYTSQVILKNVDPQVDVVSLVASIEKTVTTNNQPTKLDLQTSNQDIPIISGGPSCSTIGADQWAPIGNLENECVQCLAGRYDLSNKQICGQGNAINYITPTTDKVTASCFNNNLMYAHTANLSRVGYCQNGKWESNPPTPIVAPVIIDTRIEQEELDKQKLDEQKLAESNISSITTNQVEITKETDRITKLYADKSCGGSSVLKSNEQCVMIQGTTQYGIVPKDFAGSISYNSGATAGRPESMTNNSYQDAKTCELAKRSGETCEPNTTGGFTIVRDATPNPYIEYEFGSQSQTPTPTSTTTVPKMEYGEEPVGGGNLSSGKIDLPSGIDTYKGQSGYLGQAASDIAIITNACQISGMGSGQDLYDCFCKSMNCSDGSAAKKVATYLKENSVDSLGLQCLEFTAITVSAILKTSPICARETASGVTQSCLGDTPNGWAYCESPEEFYADDIMVFPDSGGTDNVGHIGICTDADGSPTCNTSDANFQVDNIARIHPVVVDSVKGVWRRLPDGDVRTKGCWVTNDSKNL